MSISFVNCDADFFVPNTSKKYLFMNRNLKGVKIMKNQEITTKIENDVENAMREEIEARIYKAKSDYYDVTSEYEVHIAHDKEEDAVLMIYKDGYGNIVGGDCFYFKDCNDGYFERCLPDIVHDVYVSLWGGIYGMDAEDAKAEYDAIFDEIGRIKNNRYELMMDYEIFDYIGIEYLPELD